MKGVFYVQLSTLAAQYKKKTKPICPFHTSKCRSSMYRSGEETSDALFTIIKIAIGYELVCLLPLHGVRTKESSSAQTGGQSASTFKLPASHLSLSPGTGPAATRRASCGRWDRPSEFFHEQNTEVERIGDRWVRARIQTIPNTWRTKEGEIHKSPVLLARRSTRRAAVRHSLWRQVVRPVDLYPSPSILVHTTYAIY